MKPINSKIIEKVEIEEVDIVNLIIDSFEYSTTLKSEASSFDSSKNWNDNSSILVYPTTRDKRKRVSEQEVKQVFIQKLNEFRAKNLHKRFYYSVETPTTKVYRFKDKKAKVLNNPKEGDSDYRSARTDLCIYNLSFQRLYLIEFKANNVGAKELFQDFLKLSAEWQEKIINCYFIAVVDRHDNNTINNINKKVREAFVCLENKYKDEIHENASFIAYFFFYTLNEEGVSSSLCKLTFTYSFLTPSHPGCKISSCPLIVAQSLIQ